MSDSVRDRGESGWKRLCGIGGVAAMILFAYCIITLIVLLTFGGPPGTAEETFTLLQNNKLAGLLRLDLLTVVFMPAYYLLFAGFYAALRRVQGAISALTTALAFVGVTLFLATPSIFSMVHLSDQYAAATTEAKKTLYLAAGEAIIASDMWHGTGAIAGGMFLLSAGVLISIVMLQTKVFSSVTAYVGLVTNGLDLARIFVGSFVPGVGVVLMAIAGVLYLVWFPLVGRRLCQLARGEGSLGQSSQEPAGS